MKNQVIKKNSLFKDGTEQEKSGRGQTSGMRQLCKLDTAQPFHRDSCDILTKNNILLVPNLYNNYSGLVKL